MMDDGQNTSSLAILNLCSNLTKSENEVKMPINSSDKIDSIKLLA